MAGKPHPVGEVRDAVREVLYIADGSKRTEEQILRGVRRLIGDEVTLQEVRDAMEFNLGEAFIRSAYDRMEEVNHWFITKRGQDQQRIQ
jgi:hypothetical protein